MKKKQAIQELDRRVSSLKNEFNTVKKETFENDSVWIERKLEDEDNFYL